MLRMFVFNYVNSTKKDTKYSYCSISIPFIKNYSSILLCDWSSEIWPWDWRAYMYCHIWSGINVLQSLWEWLRFSKIILCCIKVNEKTVNWTSCAYDSVLLVPDVTQSNDDKMLRFILIYFTFLYGACLLISISVSKLNHHQQHHSQDSQCVRSIGERASSTLSSNRLDLKAKRSNRKSISSTFTLLIVHLLAYINDKKATYL